MSFIDPLQRLQQKMETKKRKQEQKAKAGLRYADQNRKKIEKGSQEKRTKTRK